MSPSCIHFNKIKCFIFHEMWTFCVLCFRINGVDIISSEKQPKTFSLHEVTLKKKTISKQMFDGMKCFKIFVHF